MKQKNICVKFQSWSDIITNSSSEIFCTSNGNIDKLGDLINEILYLAGYDKDYKTLFTLCEQADVNEFKWLHEDQQDDIFQYISDSTGLSQDDIITAFDTCFNNNTLFPIESLLQEYNIKLLDVIHWFNENTKFGMIQTHYAIKMCQPKVADCKLDDLLKTLREIFDYGIYEY